MSNHIPKLTKIQAPCTVLQENQNTNRKGLYLGPGFTIQ